MAGGLLRGCARSIAFLPCVNPYLRGDAMEDFLKLAVAAVETVLSCVRTILVFSDCVHDAASIAKESS